MDEWRVRDDDLLRRKKKIVKRVDVSKTRRSRFSVFRDKIVDCENDEWSYRATISIERKPLLHLARTPFDLVHRHRIEPIIVIQRAGLPVYL